MIQQWLHEVGCLSAVALLAADPIAHEPLRLVPTPRRPCRGLGPFQIKPAYK